MARPGFLPTHEQRGVVKSMAAMGIPHEQIALKIEVRSPKTLRKHFRNELNLGAMEANYKVMLTLYKMATSGEHPAATIFWAKTRNRLREHTANDAIPAAAPPFVVAREQEGGQP
jgi:hypothetical protein